MSAEPAQTYAALYGPTAFELARGLTDVGDALAARLARLEQDPDPEEAERLARDLDGAARTCMRLREVRLRELGA